MKKQKDKNGFSLVELLAVVVILGILSVITIVSYNRYIKSARKQKEEQMKNNAIMAAKSYLQANKQYFPKNVGSMQNIQLKDLIDNNYLKVSDFTCETGMDSCGNPESDYVIVTKESNNKYEYDVSWSDTNHNSDTIPSIEDPDYDPDGVSSLNFKANLYADKDHTTNYKIRSYAYIVYLDGQEVYNSGFISGGGRSNINLNVDLTQYLKINQDNNVGVSVVVTNDKGNSVTLPPVPPTVFDGDKPYCIVQNPIGDNDILSGDDLLNKGKKRKITVDCIDNGGSKCKKRQYTKTWNKQTKISVDWNEKVENGELINECQDKDAKECYDFNIDDGKNHDWGIITLEDNAGNKSYCPVRINIDNSSDVVGPVVKVSADNGNGEHGFSEKTFPGMKENDNNYVISYSDYDTQTVDNPSENTANANGWLNAAWYPNGISYYVTATDDSGIKSVSWSTNAGSLKVGDKNIKELKRSVKYTSKDHADFFSSNKKEFKRKLWGIEGEGVRYATIVAEDNKGNKTTIEVNSKIDHTPPTIPTAKIRKDGSTGTVVSDGPNESSNTVYNYNLWWGDFAGTDAMSGTRRYEYAVNCNNPTYTAVTNSSGYTKPNSGYNTHDSCYKLRQLDNAGNYSYNTSKSNSWSDGYKMKINKPTFTYRNGFSDWKIIYNSPGVTRNNCDAWSARPAILDNQCPDGLYANVVGRAIPSYSNGTVSFNWYVTNGPATYILTGYYVQIIIVPYSSNGYTFTEDDVKPCDEYSSDKVTSCLYLKEPRGSNWDKGGSFYGTASVSLAKGSYDVYFASNTTEPGYTSYMGWIEIE